MSCRTQLQRIDRFFLRELSSSEWTKLKAHLGGCEACAQQYNRTVFVLRQLAGSADEVAEEEWALIGPEVARVGRSRRPWLSWALGGVPIAAAVVLSLLVVGPLRPDAGEVQGRGGGQHSVVALRAYCLSEAQPGALRVVATSDSSGALRCGKGELVQFAYQLRGVEPRWLHLAGVNADGQVLRYYPRPAQTTSQRLEPRASEQVLSGSIRLAGRHQPGVVRVVGLITESPLSPEEGDARVVLATQAPDAASDADVLRLLIDVLP